MATVDDADDLTTTFGASLAVAPSSDPKRPCNHCERLGCDYLPTARWVRTCPSCHKNYLVCHECKHVPCLFSGCQSLHSRGRWRERTWGGTKYYERVDDGWWQWKRPAQDVQYTFEQVSDCSLSGFTSEREDDDELEVLSDSWEPEPELEGGVALFLDIHQLLDYRPWDFKTVEGAKTDHDELPRGPGGIITIYHRPGLRLLFQELITLKNWGFCTTLGRKNAINHLDKLFARALGARIQESGEMSERLVLILPGGPRVPFWLFDSSHCYEDTQIPKPFNISSIHEITGIQKGAIVLATAVPRTCRREEESIHLLRCPVYKEAQVRDPDEHGLDSLTYTLQQLRALPIPSILPHLVELRHETMVLPLPPPVFATARPASLAGTVGETLWSWLRSSICSCVARESENVGDGIRERPA